MFSARIRTEYIANTILKANLFDFDSFFIGRIERKTMTQQVRYKPGPRTSVQEFATESESFPLSIRL
jgi:hypothetical protein